MTSDVPVPDSATVCGLPLALSAMLSEAEELPLAAGVKEITIVQLLAAATEEQVLFSLKSVGLVPVKLTALTVKAALPEFVKVTVCDELATSSGSFPKLKLVGETLTLGLPVLLPVPERVAV